MGRYGSASGRFEHRDLVELGKHLPEEPEILGAGALEVVEAVELGKANGGMHLAHTVVVAESGHVVDTGFGPLPERPVVSKRLSLRDSRRQGGVVGDHHAALDGRDVFDRIEGETACTAEGAGFASVVGRVEGKGAILDDKRADAVGDPADRVHIARQPEVMDNHDRSCSVTDQGRDRVGIDIAGIGFNIGKHWPGPAILDGMRRSDVGHGWNDDLVPGSDAIGQQRQMEARRARGDADGVSCADALGEALLELPGYRAVDKRVTRKDAYHRVDFFLTKNWTAESQLARQDGILRQIKYETLTLRPDSVASCAAKQMSNTRKTSRAVTFGSCPSRMAARKLGIRSPFAIPG